MFVTKRAIPRRAFLRGTGVLAALPLLDAMVPALTAMSKTPANPAIRLGIWGTANGVFGPDFKPDGKGTNLLAGHGLTLSRILAPMESLRDQMVVATGLSNVAAESKQVGSGVHARAASAFLSGMPAKRTEGGDIELGKTLDQYAAEELGKETQLSSLELAFESSLAGNCDQGYSCVYVNTFSWRTPTMPLPMENNPRVVFERMFGDGGTVEQRLDQFRKDRSVLDSMTAELRKLRRQLGSSDRATVSGYLEAIRDVEQRIQKAEASSASTPLPTEMGTPAGIPESFPEHAALMVDLMFLAYQADVTRVITLQTSREQGARQFPFIGVPEAHHQTSHHQGDLHLIEGNTKINAYFMQLFADLCGKMRATPDGDGTLLDHSLLLWGAALGSGDIHSPHDMPIVVAGSGGGLKGGRLLNYKLDTPFMNFGLSLLDRAGVHLKSIGDSTGHSTDL